MEGISKMSTETMTLTRTSLNGPTMGSRWTAILRAADDLDVAAIKVALAASVDRVDRQMSTWKPDSDLMRLNKAKADDWVSLPEELMSVLAAALDIGRDSHGAFDIGVGGLVEAWGFGPAAGRRDPTAIVALSGRSLATADLLELDRSASRARKRAPLQLDLAGIAKGFGVDEMARVLDGFGLSSWLVGIDGEMRGRGTKPGGAPWTIALEKPLPDRREAMAAIELTDRAIATSGDYRHQVRAGGAVLSHTMDPRSGGPARNRLASVSVLAETCMEADALATALMVLGEDAGPGFARQRRIDAVFVVRDGAGFRELVVGGA